MITLIATAQSSSHLGTMLGHLIIVTGSFVLLFVLLRFFAWDKITGIFTKRAQYITDEIDRAEKAKAEAETLVSQRQKELEAVHQEADAILLEAKRTGETMKARILSEAEKQVDEMKEKAARELERQKSEVLAHMKEEVSALSLTIAQQILMKELDPAGQSQLIDRYLEKLGD